MWPVFAPLKQTEFLDWLQNHASSGSPSVIRPDLTRDETSGIQARVFPVGAVPEGPWPPSIPSARGPFSQVPGGVCEEGAYSGAGETEQLSHTLGPQTWGLCL